jgi:hypothetical protein
MLRWLTGLTKTGPDRNSDHQRPQRVARYFDCTWMSQWGEQRARVSTLSSSGCYIESRTAPIVGTDLQDIVVMLPTGAITVQGTVVDATPGIGFAVRFTNLDTDAQARLSDLVRATSAAGASTPSSPLPPVP